MKHTTKERITSLGRRVQVPAGILALAAVGFAFTNTLTAWHRISNKPSILPYLVEVWSYEFGPDKTPEGVLFAKTIKARLSDGTTVQLSSSDKVGLELYSRRVDFTDGRYAKTVDFLQMKTTGHLLADQAARRNQALWNPSQDCTLMRGDTVIRQEEVKGILTYAVRRDSAIRQDREIYWRAPSFGCEALQYEIHIQEPDGSYRLRTRGVAVNVSKMAPAPSLFSVPADYIEAPPSTVYRTYLAHVGKDAEACKTCSADWSRQDRQYYAENR